MKEASSRHWFFFARERSASTLSAPDSSLRNARRADVSRTKLFAGGIFFLSLSPPIFQQLLYQSLFAGAPKSPNRVCRNRYDPRRGTFDDPFQCCLRPDAELLSDFRWHGDLTALGNFCTHRSRIHATIAKYKINSKLQDIIKTILYWWYWYSAPDPIPWGRPGGRTRARF
jgi:hypothetical protein